jgi:hypothetical protein
MSEVDKFKVEDGSCPIDLEDIYKMFYILVRQNQEANPGTVLSFPLEVFKTLPQKIQIAFEKKDGRLFCSRKTVACFVRCRMKKVVRVGRKKRVCCSCRRMAYF